MNDPQVKAAEALGQAVVLMAEAGPRKHARVVNIRMKNDGSMTEVQCVIFAESESMANLMEARLSEPTRAERLGIQEVPPQPGWTPVLPTV